MKNFYNFNNLISLADVMSRSSRRTDNLLSNQDATRQKDGKKTATTRQRCTMSSQGLFKKIALLLAVLVMSMANIGMAWAQTAIYASGYENGMGTWSTTGGMTVANETTHYRTGVKAIKGSYTGSNSAKYATQATGTTTTSSKSVYCHIIGWAKSANGTMKAYIGFNSSKKGSETTLSTSSWTRISYVGSEINATDIILYRKGNGSSDKYDVYFDDVVAYWSSSNTTDLTAPGFATITAHTTSALTWTEGTDSGTGNTGVQKTLIFKREDGTASGLSLNDQGIYSLTTTEGPSTDQSGNWTLVAVVNQGVTTYSTGLTEGHHYAVVHRDLAYNYSTPVYTTIEAAAAGSGWGIASSDNSWTASADEMSGSGTVTKTLSLSANADLQFKIVDISGNTWYGNGEIWGGTKTQSVSSPGTANNCHLLTTEAGSYTFSFNTSTKDLTITYPNSYTFYYANTSSWSNVYVYKFTSNGSTGNNAAWPGVEIASKAYTCGGTDYYEATSDGYAKLIFTNNSGNQTGDMVVSSSNAGKYVAGTDNSWSNFPTYTVTYNKNGDGAGGAGSVTGSVPTDSNSPYACGSTVTVLGNTGSLALDGYTFAGWNTAPGGGGTSYAANATFTISANTTLYAQWEEDASYSVTYNANGATGSVPTDANTYANGEEVTVLGKNTLAKTNYGFAGWRTAVSSGTWYVQGQTFEMGSANVNLYAQWVAEASMVSGTLYKAVDMKASAASATGQYRAGISANGIFEVLGVGVVNATTGPMEYGSDNQTIDGTAFTEALHFKGTGSGSPSGSTLPTTRAIKFRVPAAGTLHLWVRAGSKIAIVKDGGSASAVGSSTDRTHETAAVTAGTYYLYATGTSVSLYGLQFVQSCTAPTELTAASTTAKGTTFTITDGANTNDYEFYVSTESTAPEAGTTATHSVSSNKSLTITNLVAGTTYYAWARSVCGVSNKSGWTALTGTTFTTSTVSADYHLTNVTKSSGATSGIGGSTFTAVFAAVSGYSMPTPTVTIDGNTATSGTDYTWTAGTGTLTINANKINGDIDITLNSAPSAPSSAVISGTYHYFPGDNISLTVTPSGNNGPTTYQWYKGGKADGNAIDGATSATYTKNDCAFGDAGSYYCKVTCNATSIWANTNSSENYDVKILRLYVNGSKSGEPYGNVDFEKVNSTTATASIALGSNWTYGFNIADGCGHYYGNAGTMQYNNYGPWVTNVDGTDCGLTTTNAATYIFTINYSDLSSITTTVTFPVANQAAGKVIYFDNNVLKWTGSSIYYRIGHSSHSQADQLSLVPGTANLYKMTTREYNGFSGWHIANAIGDVGSGKSIYKTVDGTPITEATAHEGGAVTATAITVTPTTSKGPGADVGVNDNCEFYNYTITTGMKTDNVAITAPSNGTITVAYTDTEGASQSFTSGNRDLAHTVILTSITATPNTGYDAGAITINGGAYSANYVVTGATTIAASFTPHVYSITYKDQGNVAFSGTHTDTPSAHPTSHTYNTATNLNGATKAGYTFGGWYTSPDCSTGLVTSLGATDYTADITLYAKWTAAASLTAISADVQYNAADMANITFTSTDQIFTGLSTYNLFKVYGTNTGEKSTSTAAFGKNETISDFADDISTKSFSSALYITAADNTSSTSDPTKGAIEFITPSTAGLLYLYFPNTSSGLTLKKKGASSSTSLNGAKYKAMTVDANTHYFINGSGSNRGLYAIKYVSTYSATHTLSHVTATSGATGAGKVVKGKAYTATFTANTGYTLPSDVTVSIGGTPATKGTEYTWTVSDGTGTLTVKAANVTGAIVVTVSGVAPSGYTVTYNYNGATGGATPASATGTSVTLPTPTRTGYELDGWYTTAGTKVEDGGETYVPEADITLYARWQEACDAEGVAKSTTDVASTGYTTYQEKGGSNVAFTSTPSLGFKYKDADGNIINSSTTAVVRNNAYSCQIKSSSSNKGSIKTNSTFSNVDSISFYFAASDKGGCKIAVWCSTDNFSTDSTSLLSATTYGDSNNEFKLKTLAIPSGKKASTLTFKFRFTATSSGKTSYIDSLKVYSSTSGGGTCYHVYYHGNGAESGYVNDTVSYTAGSKATVLNYNYGRYPLAKAGYDFRGWATSASGAVAYSAGQKIDITSADVDLYAVWATASTALVTWEKKVNVATWTDNTTPSTTDPTNIGTIGSSATLIASPSSNSTKTPQIQLASGASNADKGASFTFSMKSADKVVVPTKVSCEVANVGGESNGDITYKAVLTDGAGNTYYSTNSICPNNNGTLNPIDFVFSSGLSLRGDITVKVYAWLSGSGSGFSFRMGPDVKFYGTVDDYACATPAAPTISGVSEYVPGQTITLTASHDGDNHDGLTTYTWYKGVDWATASSTTPVQAAATGESGYTLTIADCTTGNVGLYWCEAANGTCNAHNAAGYDVTVFPPYTITYHLDGGTLDGTEKTSYTQFDEDYTLPIPTKTGYVFAGWYEASDFSGVTVTVLGSGAIGDKNYYAKWGTAVTATWSVTKVDGVLYRGGGGYSVTVVIDQANWDEAPSNGDKDELELTATEGVTLKNIVKSINDAGKAQVTADFDITTDLAADATSITFTLNVPASTSYGPAELTKDEDLTSCGGGFDTDNSYVIGKSNSDATNISSSAALRAYKTASDWYSKGNTTFTDKTSTDGFTISAAEKSYYWQNNGTFTESSSSNCRLKTIKLAKSNGVTIRWTNDELSFSKVRFIGRNTAAGDPTTFTVSNGTTEKTFTFEAGNSEIQTKEVTMDFVSGNTKGIVISGGTKEINILIELIPTSVGGVTPTLSWTPALNMDADWDSGNDRLNKETGDPDFTFVANQNKNSLGTITYSSSDETVATVNAAGTVHIVGSEGDATITATLAASGCFNKATATYNIHVVDNCIDVPGTISTEDLGCDGIKMTVSGHTTSGETVSYQWYKDGVSLAPDAQEATYTTSAAGEYYVIVTNTGTDHCAMASTNTIKVAAKAAISVPTNIVDSWYVKNGRRTPDIALWKTTGVSAFTVKNNAGGATIENIGGCTFYLGDDGIIYLKGTTSTGAAPSGMEAGDLVIKAEVNDECGSNTKTSSTITIHCQAATTYKEIAFVADGGKGMKKDSITVGHGDGTELYEYLDSVTVAGKRLFKLSERNIYWTTDEKAIREEYSQFDGILITDDPSTNTTPEGDYKTKGYVNAFGTMVDVRPIFTMEAYVSALKNWGSKGIAGNPQSPNPRQYEMRLECKDHEIYGAGLPDPEDGTNVWEEVIDGETFRHVILVDSTKGVYKGVAYNAETAGDKKPALQGFTGEAAGSLLGLGRILEGTLQAAIERQEEPAARLLVMGVNAKALRPTSALTPEGKIVIKNILVYLLKTNMEEVDDCSNYFTGKIDDDWSKAGNWSKSALPSSEAKVRILAPCVISGIQPHVLQVSIVNSGNSNIRNTATGSAVCNGTLTIEPDGALIADGKIRSAVAPHFAANDLKPTTPEMLTINTRSDAQAALIFNNEEGLTKATVNLYSLGRKPSSYQYQYFAVPMEVVPVNPAFANETHGGTGIYTYVYSEATSGWTRRKYYDDLFAFEGLGITTKSTVAMNYTMTGTLASTATKEITLTHDGAGLNLVGNSWMAPIQIGALAEDNTDANITQTVYIYCAGRDIVEGAATSGVTETAGQWIAIPFEAAEFETWKAAGKLSVIPAMQAFQIKVDDEATLTLDYDKVVRGSTNDLNAKLRAPRRRVAAKEVTMTNIRVSDSKTHTDLSLFEGDRFSEAFDNGWEAEYMSGDGRSAKLYAETEAGQMAVAAMYDYEGTVVGFAPGQETEYTFSFMGEDNGYYLNDIKLQNSVRISEGETYTFTYEEGDTANRFYISRTPLGISDVPTGVDNVHEEAKPRKFIYNDKMYILYNGRVFDATGKVVK